MRANEIWAKRTMGQNFLVDGEVLKKIIAAADLKPSDNVLEIGPGLGVLTEELAEKAGKVIAVEKDDFLAQALKDKIRISTEPKMQRIQIIHGDALELSTEESGVSTYKLVANIPYNITSLIIRKFLEEKNQPELMVLMVQKEVAERIVAKPGKMSLLSVSVQFYAEAEIISMVKNDSFFPVPKVDSAIIRLKIKKREERSILSGEIEEKEFFRIVKFGFAAKRKTLENNLASGLHISKIDASAIIKSAGLEAKIRAESLSIADWKKLYHLISDLIRNPEIYKDPESSSG